MKDLLHSEIKREFERLETMEPGTEEYKVAVDGLTKLADRAIEMDKLESGNEENELKREQMKEETKDRWVRNLLTAAGIIIPSIITIWGTNKSLKFEETGTVTTMAGRSFINALFRKK